MPVSVAAGTVQFTSTASSYASLVVQSGTAQLGASNALPTGVSIDLGTAAAANLDLAGFQQTILGITQDSFAATIGNSSATADSTLTTTGTSSFAGVIQDTLGGGTHEVHVAVSSGHFTLSGANTYTGGTTISGGTAHRLRARTAALRRRLRPCCCSTAARSIWRPTPASRLTTRRSAATWKSAPSGQPPVRASRSRWGR